MPDQVVEDAVQRLLEQDLLVRFPGSPDLVRYGPQDLELDGDVTALTKLMAEDPVPLIRTMNESSMDRLRGSARRTFADCLSIKKPNKSE